MSTVARRAVRPATHPPRAATPGPASARPPAPADAYKRPFDLAVLGAAAAVLLPLGLGIALAVRLEGRGPVLYRQVRLGRGGREFEIVKFRTMVDGAEARTGPVLAAAGDGRVTPLGRFLRRWRLDELPQAWNVLRGEMSLVGPRPERPALALRHAREAPGFGARLRVRPGVAGLAQARGGYRLPARDKLRYDNVYIGAMGPWLDLCLCLLCLWRVAVPLHRPRAALRPPAGPPPGVSVIVPAGEETEAALAAALRSALGQDYAGPLEVVVADGSAGGRLRARLGARFPSVRWVANRAGTTPAALNRALAAARHEVVARCDARCELPSGYLRRAVATLRRTGAANVGGMQRAAGRTTFERAVAMAMGSRLGAGAARYRVGGRAGPVETVFLGVYRRDALAAAGGFDESLARNQDYELNHRLRGRGGTVWFDPALAVRYRPRGSARALARQYFEYGQWKRVVLRRHPGSVRLRQLAAPLLLLALGAGAALALGGLAGGAPGAAALGGAVPGAYAAALAAVAAYAGVRQRDAAAVWVSVALAVMHLAWGAGFLFARRPRQRDA